MRDPCENSQKKTGGSVAIKTGAGADRGRFARAQIALGCCILATHGFFLPKWSWRFRLRAFVQCAEIPRGSSSTRCTQAVWALAGAQTTLEAWGRGEVPASENDGILRRKRSENAQPGGHLAGDPFRLRNRQRSRREAGEGVLGFGAAASSSRRQNLLMTLWPSRRYDCRDHARFLTARSKTGNARRRSRTYSVSGS